MQSINMLSLHCFNTCRKPVKESTLWGTWSGKLLDLHHMRRGSLSFLKLERTNVHWKLLKESWALTRGQRRSVRKCLMFSARWGKSSWKFCPLQVLSKLQFFFLIWVLFQPIIILLSTIIVSWCSFIVSWWKLKWQSRIFFCGNFAYRSGGAGEKKKWSYHLILK